MRILNKEMLLESGFQQGREKVLNIMEAGLSAADPYENAKQLLRREKNMLYIGNKNFEADNDPDSGIEEVDLNVIGNIYVVGAGKGVQRVALALEEVLGDHLTDGAVTAKYGDDLLLKRVRVTYGAHPVPDEGCVEGSKKIYELAEKVTDRDLVFTIIANGGSSLLTLPEDGISLDDVKKLTYMMQIEKGATTVDLNVIRNHIDKLKGGRLARLFEKAKQIHIVVTDANHHVIQADRHDYFGLLRENVWLHNLPENTTFAQAIEILHKYDAWEQCPESIRAFLEQADESKETVKYEEFIKTKFRVFGVMPDSSHFLPAACKAAEKMGIKPVILSQTIHAEAQQCAKILSSIARNIEEYEQPLKKPVVLLSSGEMLVTVKDNVGVGGRNQEFVLACAKEIRGTHIVIASADSDGTDGPGGLELQDAPKCLGGGIVDGDTYDLAVEKGVDIEKSLSSHGTSEALWKLGCGLSMSQNISLNDLTVILVE